MDADAARQRSKSRRFLITAIPYMVVICLLAGLVIWLNLSWRPDVAQLPPDSGFYAYYAKAILHGQLPYKDLWDNKPPFGYYLNALGLLIFGQTAWGVWWFSMLWMTACSFLCFLVFKKLFGWITALIAAPLFVIAIMDPQVFQGGNLTEVYALAPLIGIIGVTYQFFTHQRKARFALLAGVLTACSLMIKQPTLALGISSILVMTAAALSEGKFRAGMRIIVAYGIGFLSLLGLVALYFLSRNALGEFIDGVFRQGFSTIGGSQSSYRYFFKYALSTILPGLNIGKLYVLALVAGATFLFGKIYRTWLRPVFKAHLGWLEWLLLVILVIIPLVARRYLPGPYSFLFWLISIAVAGLFFMLKFYRLTSRPSINPVFSPLEWTWLVALVALPAEAFFVSLGGRYYGHYFTTMIPSILLACIYPIWRVVAILFPLSKSIRPLLANSAYALLAVGVLAWGGFTFNRDIPSPDVLKNIAGIFDPRVHLDELQQYIVDHTQPTDTVLVWHIHLGINFVTGRYSPSRFLYPLNLFIPPSPGNTKLKQYVDELENHPPELIVVQKVSSIGLPFVDQPLDGLCERNCTPDFSNAIALPEIRQQWLRFQDFFDAHYTAAAEIYDWIIYRKSP